MAMYARQRDVSLVNHLNRELMGNIITQQCAIYQYKLEETKVNIYGESSAEKFYNGPFLFNVLIISKLLLLILLSKHFLISSSLPKIL